MHQQTLSPSSSPCKGNSGELALDWKDWAAPGVPVRVFLETGVWVGGLSREHPPQCGWAPSNRVGVQMEDKGRVRPHFCSLTSGTPFSCPCKPEFQALWLLESETHTSSGQALQTWTESYIIASLVLRPSGLDWAKSLAFLVLQLADKPTAYCGSQPSKSREPIPTINLFSLGIVTKILRSIIQPQK